MNSSVNGIFKPLCEAQHNNSETRPFVGLSGLIPFKTNLYRSNENLGLSLFFKGDLSNNMVTEVCNDQITMDIYGHTIWRIKKSD